MRPFKELIQDIRAMLAKYPAVVSAIFIYGYLLYSLIRFFHSAVGTSLGFWDFLEIFDALPFMWLLSVTLVMIIEIRTRLHESEQQRLIRENELNIRTTQMNTLREVAVGVQHEINSPLTVINLNIYKMKNLPSNSDELKPFLESLENESKRISSALKALSELEEYKSDPVNPSVGGMVILGNNEKPLP